MEKLKEGFDATGVSAVAAGEDVLKAGEDCNVAAGEVQGLGRQMVVASAGAKEMGEVMTLAGEKAKFSMYEARGEIGLIGEEIGVRLPRHVRSFLAELPAVGQALSAAFEATAVLFIAQAIAEATQKLTDFIISTFIFTESMKQSDEIIKKSNADIGKYSEETNKLKDAFLTLGLQGAAKTAAEMRLLTRDINANSVALENAKNKANALHAEFGDDKNKAGEIAQADAELAASVAIAKELEQKKTNLAKQGAQERQADAEKAALAQVKIEEAQAISIANLKAQENRALATEHNSGLNQLLQIESQHQLELYQIKLTALQRTLALEKGDTTKDKDAAKKTAEEIERIQRDHAANLFKIYADTIHAINTLSLGDVGRQDIGSKILGTDFKDKFAQAEEAAQQLGVTLSGSVAANALKAKEAFDELKASGVASAHDLLDAEIQLTIANVNNARASGQSAKATKDLILAQEQRISSAIEVARATGQDTRELLRVQKILEQLDGTFHRGKPTFDSFFKDLTAGSLRAGQAIKQLGTLVAEGIGASVQAAVSGSQGFGQALEQMAKSALAALAGEAVVKVLHEIALTFSDYAAAASAAANPFTAWEAPGYILAAHAHELAALKWGAIGAGAAVGGALIPSGSSGSSSSSTSSHPTTPITSPAATPTQQPVSVVNTPHLYAGGLLTQKTLAMVGDAPGGGNSRKGEGIIPLDDDRAMEAIAGAIAERMPQHRGGNIINVHIDGVISADNLQKVFKQANDAVGKGTMRFNSSNSFRVTRRG